MGKFKITKQIEKKEASDREYFENVLCKGATTMITLIEMMESKRVLPNQQLRIRELLDTREKKGFFIRWGFVAQLLDDMRDIVEDREVGTHTYINTRNATELETAVRGIFNFIVHHIISTSPSKLRSDPCLCPLLPFDYFQNFPLFCLLCPLFHSSHSIFH